MNLSDATLVFVAESAGHPSVARIAQSAYDRLVSDGEVDYRILDELLGEASGKGILRALHSKYHPVAYEAILAPIMAEIGRSKPIRTSRPEWHPTPGADPLA
ncbi:MAG TPA: hypothetical protein VH478_06260 [Trebonia sp.]|jgi:hypothetical protein|nr:hypothetical protein [Trebonia sp.]